MDWLLLLLLFLVNGLFSLAYKPYKVPCSTFNLVRRANRIHSQEKNYLARKGPARSESLRQMLSRIDVPGLDLDILEETNIGLSFSGGGFRAMLLGAGVIAALDERIDEGSDLSGLFQSSSYVSGLSGGSWLLGSLYHNSMPTTLELRDSRFVWDLNMDRVEVPSSQLLSVDYDDSDGSEDEFEAMLGMPEVDLMRHIDDLFPLDYVNYYMQIHKEVQEKAQAGYKVSIVDYWGRGLSLHLINGSRGGVNRCWSDISGYEYWNDKSMPVPIPIVVANERISDRRSTSVPTVVEFTPFEMGSWCHSLGAFSHLPHIGTYLYAGTASEEDGYCVKGFDNVGFVMATSSAIFNDLLFLYPGLIGFNGSIENGFLMPCQHGQTDWVIDGIPGSMGVTTTTLGNFKPLARERAFYNPNPFFGYNPTDLNRNVTHSRELHLVDGGVDGQNMPIEPLIQPSRKLDVIFAYDFSGDIENWPSAVSLRHTYKKFRQNMYNVSFPHIPRTISVGRPWTRTLFLGCFAKDYSSNEIGGPIIVYIPNTGYNFNSNIPTMRLNFSHRLMSQVMKNGYNVATNGNSSDWSTCVACIVALRAYQREGMDPPQACTGCYHEYCYSRV